MRSVSVSVRESCLKFHAKASQFLNIGDVTHAQKSPGEVDDVTLLYLRSLLSFLDAEKIIIDFSFLL